MLDKRSIASLLYYATFFVNTFN